MKYPVVLAHGVAPFDEFYRSFPSRLAQLFGLSEDQFAYFRGIATHLRKAGFKVYSPRVSFAARQNVRAKDLAREIKQILVDSESPKLHIIAHSMGGLDARHMIVDEGMAEAVATLTTVATPHRGTSFADTVVDIGGASLEAAKKLGIDLTGLADLRTKVCEEFNKRAVSFEAANSVHYVTYASQQRRERVFAPLQVSSKIISEREGENDGLVPLTSQKWTTKLQGQNIEKSVSQFEFPFEADHLNELAWWDLDELRGTHWWNFDLIRKIAAFEQRVRDLYLEMARHAESLVAD